MDLKAMRYEIKESVAIITLNNPPVNGLDISSTGCHLAFLRR